MIKQRTQTTKIGGKLVRKKITVIKSKGSIKLTGAPSRKDPIMVSGALRKATKSATDKAISLASNQRLNEKIDRKKLSDQKLRQTAKIKKYSIMVQTAIDTPAMIQHRKDLKTMNVVFNPLANNYNKGIDNPYGHNGAFVSDYQTPAKEIARVESHKVETPPEWDLYNLMEIARDQAAEMKAKNAKLRHFETIRSMGSVTFGSSFDYSDKFKQCAPELCKYVPKGNTIHTAIKDKDRTNWKESKLSDRYKSYKV